MTEYNVQITLFPFPLHPEIPNEGTSIEAIFQGRENQLAEMRKNMEKLMGEEGLAYTPQKKIPNTRLAQELGTWAHHELAAGAGGGDIHLKLFEAYFVEAKDIGEVEVLADIAAEMGLDQTKALEVLTKRSFSEPVDGMWKKAVGMGVRAVPTYVSEGDYLVGAQPYKILETFAQEAGATKREK